ncbi:FOG: Ankyrin repeat-like protein [Pedosphaera parvula Ellin514]|uniref:FOG: Ankyrin repeat-like protein n=1 Tax=Pedosphaera parvula (strain Ellin514) TaxID=320771 RepID=B9XEM5_PEDPL|nr:FOG: Ankyrin repeat-like protein [Pedosphaera parvula Ellin514]
MNEIMKRVRWSLMVLGIALFAMTGLAATNDVSGMLQKGLFEEEANRNLDAAIQAYQGAIAQTDKDRKFAATAIFRLGECYRKQGKTNEATVQYERIVKEFADQPELVKLSQGYVENGGKSSVTNGTFVDRLQATVKSPPPAGVLGFRPALSVEDQKIEQIQNMIKDSPDLINTPVNGAAPLNQAADEGQLKVVKFLLDNGANIEAIDTQTGRTPLIEASQRGNKSMVALLLEHGANVNAMQRGSARLTSRATSAPSTDELGYTSLHHAAMNGFRAIAEELIAHKADVNARSQNGKSPLHLAAEKGFKSVAELLLAKGAEVNAVDSAGNTPLYAAALAANRAIVELLLANHADANIRNVEGYAPLHVAASDRGLEIVKLLLEKNADIKAKTRNGYTPLMAAVSTGSKQAVDLLLATGAEVNAQTDQNQTALNLAVANRSADIVASIFKSKPQLEVLNNQGYTPLQSALVNNDVKIAGLLLDAGANVNAPFKQGGASPMQIAVQQRNQQMITLLLEHKADINQQDNGGTTAISMAKSYANRSDVAAIDREKMSEIVEQLRKAGANENLRRLSVIGISREDLIKDIFLKGTNAYNNYTLFELIARSYTPDAWANHWTAKGEEPPGLRFPDFTKITISRLEEDGRTNSLKLNLEAALTNGDCSKDILLKWGDIVEIPELDHSVTEQWSGLPGKITATLIKCLERNVTIIVKGKSTKVILAPGLPTVAEFQAQFVSRPASPDIRISSFWLPKVLFEANVLLASSDLTRVKVKRTDPGTKKTEEMVFDLKADIQKRTQQGKLPTRQFVFAYVKLNRPIDETEPFMSANSLWLRDGDVIEIPEKQP